MVAGILIERVTGAPFAEVLSTRVFEPLGMTDTAFWVPEDKIDRLAQCYQRQDRKLAVFKTRYDKPPKLESGAGGLAGTLDDYHRFASALATGGAPIIGRKTLEYMTLNHLPGGVDLSTHAFSEGDASETAMPGVGFGLGFGVVIDPPANKSLASKGEYMWGGAASTAFWVDPVEEISVVFMTQLFPSATYPIRPQLRWVVNQALVN
jgi:CubicO group peptidase (beta-lactamase class C family)